MNKYEVLVILKPLLPDDIRRGTMQKVEKLISSQKGKVKKTEIWGKRHLAYEISGHRDGYYVLWGVELPAEAVKKFETEVKIIPEVLRYSILRVEEFDLKEIK